MNKRILPIIGLLLLSAACNQVKPQVEIKENPFRKRQVETLTAEVADLKEKLATSELGFKHDRDMIRLLIEDRLKMVEMFNLLRRASKELNSGKICKYENTVKEITNIGRTLALDPMK